MKRFNVVCLTTLLVCGAYCTSSLHAESSEFTEQQDQNLSMGTTGQNDQEIELSKSRDIPGATGDINSVYFHVGENAEGNAVEIITEVSISNEAIDNAVTTIETEAPIVANDIDAMVEELVQSGAVQNDIATLESQPQWKLFLASIASSLLSFGISCQQLLGNIFTSLQTALSGNGAAKKSPKKV